MDLSIGSLPFIFIFIYVTVALVIVLVATLATFLQNRFVVSQITPQTTEERPEISKASATPKSSTMQEPLQVQLTVVVQQVADFEPSSAPEFKQPSATQQPSVVQEAPAVQVPTEPQGLLACQESPMIEEPSTIQEASAAREDAEIVKAPVIQELATTSTPEPSADPETPASATHISPTYTLTSPEQIAVLSMRNEEMQQRLQDMRIALT